MALKLDTFSENLVSSALSSGGSGAWSGRSYIEGLLASVDWNALAGEDESLWLKIKGIRCELKNLGTERCAAIFWRDYLGLGRRLAGDTVLASLGLQMLSAVEKYASEEGLRASARRALEVVQGIGKSISQAAESFLLHTPSQLSDVSSLAAMGAAGLSFRLGKLLTMAGSGARVGASVGRVSLNFLGTLGGTATEIVAFPLVRKGVNEILTGRERWGWSDISESLVHSAQFLLPIKGAHVLSQGWLRVIHGARRAGSFIPQRFSSYYQAHHRMASSGFSLGGIMVGEYWQEAADVSRSFVQRLSSGVGTLFHLKMAGALLPGVFPGLEAWNQRIALSTSRALEQGWSRLQARGMNWLSRGSNFPNGSGSVYGKQLALAMGGVGKEALDVGDCISKAEAPKKPEAIRMDGGRAVREGVSNNHVHSKFLKVLEGHIPTQMDALKPVLARVIIEFRIRQPKHARNTRLELVEEAIRDRDPPLRLAIKIKKLLEAAPQFARFLCSDKAFLEWMGEESKIVSKDFSIAILADEISHDHPVLRILDKEMRGVPVKQGWLAFRRAVRKQERVSQTSHKDRDHVFALEAFDRPVIKLNGEIGIQLGNVKDISLALRYHGESLVQAFAFERLSLSALLEISLCAAMGQDLETTIRRRADLFGRPSGPLVAQESVTLGVKGKSTASEVEAFFSSHPHLWGVRHFMYLNRGEARVHATIGALDGGKYFAFNEKNVGVVCKLNSSGWMEDIEFLEAFPDTQKAKLYIAELAVSKLSASVNHGSKRSDDKWSLWTFGERLLGRFYQPELEAIFDDPQKLMDQLRVWWWINHGSEPFPLAKKGGSLTLTANLGYGAHEYYKFRFLSEEEYRQDLAQATSGTGKGKKPKILRPFFTFVADPKHPGRRVGLKEVKGKATGDLAIAWLKGHSRVSENPVLLGALNRKWELPAAKKINPTPDQIAVFVAQVQASNGGCLREVINTLELVDGRKYPSRRRITLWGHKETYRGSPTKVTNIAFAFDDNKPDGLHRKARPFYFFELARNSVEVEEYKPQRGKRRPWK